MIRGSNGPSVPTNLTGQGKNGRDPMTVTYTTPGTKTVTVQATAPLSQSLTATASFDIIQGVDPAAVVVTGTPAAQLGRE